MASLNKAILLGRLGKDAETQYTPSGIPVTKFSLATDRNWKDKQSGEWKKETDWHNVVLWRNEGVTQYLVKGAQVCVEGRIQTRKYEDKNGNTRYTTEIVAERIMLCGAGRQSSDADEPVSRPRHSAAASTPPGQPSHLAPDEIYGPLSDDDVPF